MGPGEAWPDVARVLGGRCGSDRAARGSAAPGRCSPHRRRASASPRRPHAPRATRRCPLARPAGSPERGHRRGPSAHRAWHLERDALCGTPRLGARRGTSSDPRATGGAQESQSAPQSRGLVAQRPRGGGRPARTAAGLLERGRASRAAWVKAPGRDTPASRWDRRLPLRGGPGAAPAHPPPHARGFERSLLRHSTHRPHHANTRTHTTGRSHYGPIGFTFLQQHVLAVPHSTLSTCPPETHCTHRPSVWLLHLWTSSQANIPIPRGTHTSTAPGGMPNPFRPHRDAH